MTPFNEQLMNYANYADKRKLRQLLRGYYALYIAALKGDTVATAIYIDLKNALFAEGVLSIPQRACIVACLIGGETQTVIADEFEITQPAVNKHIRTGIKKIQTFLN